MEEGDGKVITYDKEGEEVEEEKGITKETKADTNAAGDVMDNIDAADAKKEIAEVSEVNAVVAEDTITAGALKDKAKTGAALKDGKVITYDKEGEEVEEEKGITKETKADTNAAGDVMDNIDAADAKKEIAEVSEVNADDC